MTMTSFQNLGHKTTKLSTFVLHWIVVIAWHVRLRLNVVGSWHHTVHVYISQLKSIHVLPRFRFAIFSFSDLFPLFLPFQSDKSHKTEPQLELPIHGMKKFFKFDNPGMNLSKNTKKKTNWQNVQIGKKIKRIKLDKNQLKKQNINKSQFIIYHWCQIGIEISSHGKTQNNNVINHGLKIISIYVK